jgi:hypothetical protein
MDRRLEIGQMAFVVTAVILAALGVDERNGDISPTDQSSLGHFVGSETNTGRIGCTLSNLINAGGNTRTAVGAVTQLDTPAEYTCRISGAP